jgi:hypothetical protein
LEVVSQETILREVTNRLGELILKATKPQALPKLGWEAVVVGGAMYRKAEIIAVGDKPYDPTLEMLMGLCLTKNSPEGVVDARYQ